MFLKNSVILFCSVLFWADFSKASDALKEEEQEIQRNPTSLATPTNQNGWKTRRLDPKYNKLKRHSPREGEEARALLRQLSLPAAPSPIQTKQLSLTPRARSDTVSGQMNHSILIKSTSDLDLRRALSRRSSSQPNTPRTAAAPLDQTTSDNEGCDPQD